MAVSNITRLLIAGMVVSAYPTMAMAQATLQGRMGGFQSSPSGFRSQLGGNAAVQPSSPNRAQQTNNAAANSQPVTRQQRALPPR